MNKGLDIFFDFLPVLIFIIFVLIIIASTAAKLKPKKTARTMRQKAAMSGRTQPRTVSQQNADRAIHAYRMLEDRENDWLARQRREEAATERRFSAMYGLKRMHEENCPARNLRDEHRRNCDATSIDTAKGE